MRFFTIIKFCLYHNGRGTEKHQRIYKVNKRFNNYTQAKKHAIKLFKNKKCICIQIDLSDEYGTLDTVFERVR